MTRTVHLRRWQKAALDRFVASPKRDFLAVATPGRRQDDLRAHGRAARARRQRPARLIVVAPTAHLKHQWARAAARVLAPPRPVVVAGRRRAARPTCTGSSPPTSRSRRAPPLLARLAARRVRRPRRAAPRRRRPRLGRRDPAGVRAGAAAGSRSRARRFARTRARSRSSPTAATRRCPTSSTATATRSPTGGSCGPSSSRRRTARWSGRRPTARSTPRRSTTALDAAAREPAAADGALARGRVAAGRAARGATSACRRCAREQPDAGGLVIAIDREHARGIADAPARALRRDRAASSPPTIRSASAEIARFAAATEPWLVAVRMVSEGVDIPRLRVGVYATTTATELFFRQAVGRLVRWTRGVPRQRAWLFIPDDPRLRTHAARDRRAAPPLAAPRRRRRAEPARTAEERERGRRASSCRSSPRSPPSRPTPTTQPTTTSTTRRRATTTATTRSSSRSRRRRRSPAAAGGADGGALTRREEKQQLRDANAQRRARARPPHRPHARRGQRRAQPALAACGGSRRRRSTQLERRLAAADSGSRKPELGARALLELALLRAHVAQASPRARRRTASACHAWRSTERVGARRSGCRRVEDPQALALVDLALPLVAQNGARFLCLCELDELVEG